MEQDNLAIWPEVLPMIQDTGYKYDPNIDIIKAKKNLGFSPDITIRQKNPPQLITAKLRCLPDQQAMFEWFFHKKLYSGALWFQMPVKTPNGIETKRAKIIGSMKTNYVNPYFDTSLKIELYE